MSDIVKKGWQDGTLIIIAEYCAILQTADNFIPLYIYIKNKKAYNCPYNLSVGDDIKNMLNFYEGKVKVRYLLHNNDLILIKNEK